MRVQGNMIAPLQRTAQEAGQVFCGRKEDDLSRSRTLRDRDAAFTFIKADGRVILEDAKVGMLDLEQVIAIAVETCIYLEFARLMGTVH